jgi:ABC-type nickel/cobalt efflux system permease component RcnA
MLGLDQAIAGLSDGSTLVLVLLVAALLGLRHATDPDHVAAVTTLVAGGGRTAAGARRLGLAWGLGHAVTLFALGLPAVLYARYLPAPVQDAAEAAIGLVIVTLALWLLVRWRRGAFHAHPHRHGQVEHTHLHSHAGSSAHEHGHALRTPAQALGIGLLHGVGGSAGVGVLIVATVDSKALAVVALAVLAAGTAVSMTLLTAGLGLALATGPARQAWNRVVPALGVAGLLLGCWYVAGALGLSYV